MPPTLTLQELSDAIVRLAGQIMDLNEGPRKEQYAAFLRGTPTQQARVVGALGLTPAQLTELVASADETAASSPTGKSGGPRRQAQPWDYDPASATIGDLSRRRALLQSRLRILQYFLSH